MEQFSEFSPDYTAQAMPVNLEGPEFQAKDLMVQSKLLEMLIASSKEAGSASTDSISSESKTPEQIELEAYLNFQDNYAAAFRFLIITDTGLQNRIMYSSDISPQLVHSIMESLQSPEMKIRNQVLEILKVGKKVKEGGITWDEYLTYCEPTFKQLFSTHELVQDSDLSKLFEANIDNIRKRRPLPEQEKQN